MKRGKRYLFDETLKLRRTGKSIAWDIYTQEGRSWHIAGPNLP